MARLRRQALETMYRAQRLEAKGEKTLDEVRELLVKADVFLDLLQDIADTVSDILDRIEQHGANINPTVGETVIPIGVNVSVPEEQKS